MKLHETGAYLVNGCTVVEDNSEASAAIASMTGTAVSKEEAAKNTIAYGILKDHNTSGSMEELSRQPEHPDWKSFQFLMY